MTHALVGGLRSADMVEPYLVHYPSRDGKCTISAFVYVPNNITPNGKFPAIVYIHGGPTSQFVNGFDRWCNTSSIRAISSSRPTTAAPPAMARSS